MAVRLLWKSQLRLRFALTLGAGVWVETVGNGLSVIRCVLQNGPAAAAHVEPGQRKLNVKGEVVVLVEVKIDTWVE